jgi:alkylhydroperoxidase family enzyme
MARIAPKAWDALDPASRRRIEEGVATGMYTETDSMRIMAHSPEAFAGMHESYKAVFKAGTMGMRLQELLRIRSAQLNGCDLCASSRKDDAMQDEDLSCAVDAEGAQYTERERLALRLLTLMATDHHKIDAAFFRQLATVFNAREVIEVAWFCGQCIGTHRLMHALDVIGNDAPVLGADGGDELRQVGT